VVSRQLGIDASHMPGSGAAGGAAYGLHCFLNARFISGTAYVLGINGVEDYIRKYPVDYIVTGEGRIDGQTLHGKLIKGVLEMANNYNIPVLVVCGACDIPEEAIKGVGIRKVIEVSDTARPLAYNMAHAARLTREAVNRYFQDMQDG
jgi:glycerate kinase